MTRITLSFALSLAALALLIISPATADDKSSKQAKEPTKAKSAEKPDAAAGDSTPAAPPTCKVEKGVFKIETELDGVFEAQSRTEVALHPKNWSEFQILTAVEHGAHVKRGDTLVTLDMEKIDRAITDLKRQQELSDLGIKLAQKRLELLEKSTPLDLAVGKRLQEYAHEDLAYFLKVDRPMSEKMANFMLRLAEQNLEYQREELRQLEKMYKADDLTEETEEIVLKRARNEVAQAEFVLGMYKVRHDRALKTDLPRQDVGVKDTTERAELTGNKALQELPIVLEKERLELKALQTERTRSDERLTKLLADREAMGLKAPVDGVVYYGKADGGKFSEVDSIRDKLRRGGNLLANDTFMTIVQTRPMAIRSAVPEKQLQYVRSGLKGVAEPVGYPDLRLKATVERVAAVPGTGGNFDTRLSVELPHEAGALMPGMTCKVKFVPYLKKDALILPPKAVQTDELDDQKHFVYRPAKDGKSKKQPVKVGKRADKKVEILEGLSAGDQVLLESPEKKD